MLTKFNPIRRVLDKKWYESWFCRDKDFLSRIEICGTYHSAWTTLLNHYLTLQSFKIVAFAQKDFE
jgi:hypothetical protein